MDAKEEIFLTKEEVNILDTKLRGTAETIKKVEEGFNYIRFMTENKFKSNVEFKHKVDTLAYNITILSDQIKILRTVTDRV